MSENDWRDEANPVNIPLLRKAVQWAEAEAAKPFELCEWFQASWKSDPRLAAKFDERGNFLEGSVGTKSADCGTCYCIAGFIVSSQGREEGVDSSYGDMAADLLGLERDRCEPLFRSDNSIEDVREIAESLAGERL